jgi:hypothetical protein
MAKWRACGHEQTCRGLGLGNACKVVKHQGPRTEACLGMLSEEGAAGRDVPRLGNCTGSGLVTRDNVQWRIRSGKEVNRELRIRRSVGGYLAKESEQGD